VRNELDEYLARCARELSLTPDRLETADAETLRGFCAVVLRELAARGLLPSGDSVRSGEDVGCYAAPRASGN